MKILSKWRDYYDHLVGHYGFDETIVYDRRNLKGKNFNPVPCSTGYDQFVFHVCGKKVPVVRIGKMHFFEPEKCKHISKIKTRQYGYSWTRNINPSLFLNDHVGKKTDLNVKHRQPVLVEYRGNVYIPILEQFGFPSYIDAHEMYRKVYDFLSWLKDNPEAPQITDNDCKIKAHGFHTKRSFRPNMKK